MKKILITSVGSLVGNNFLDALTNRREGVAIVGTNSISSASNNYRCDKCYLVSPVEATDVFKSEILNIVNQEKPDALVAGRDDDVVILAELAEEYKIIKDIYIGGNVLLARAMDDKTLSYNFAQIHKLPFAPTIKSDTKNILTEAEKMVAKFGFPLIAKPTKGNGSRGIWIVCEQEQLKKVCAEKDFSLQPFFRSQNEEKTTLDTTFGLPFFWEIPEQYLYAGQAIIGKNYQVQKVIAYKALMIRGKCEQLELFEDKNLVKLVLQFAETVAKKGWRGPFNVQFKKDDNLGYQAIEMNGRFSGGSSARYYLGFDEIGDLLNDWFDEKIIPDNDQLRLVSKVEKILTDYPIDDEYIAQLDNDRIWTKA